MIYYSDGSTSL